MWKLFLDCLLASGGYGANGAKCMFPFEYNGKTYNSCTKDDEIALWCKTDDGGNWGYCYLGSDDACGNFKSV